MPPPKFKPDTCAGIVALVGEGLSLKDAAAAQGDVSETTLKKWLTRGRREESGPYTDFATAVEAARRGVAEREQPMDRDELFLAVSRAARKGSVQAQKLYWEMIRGEDDSAEPEDQFDQLDQETDD